MQTLIRLIALAALALAATTASAQGPGAVRKQIEATMLLTGHVDIDADGRVTGYALDQQEKLDATVKSLVARSVPHWRFEPGAAAREPMSLRLLAKRLDEERMQVRIASAHFGKPESIEGLSVAKRPSIRYPDVAARAGATGRVILAVKIGRDGTVEDIVAEKVDLRFVAPERSMEKLRESLAAAAIRGVRQWTYNVPVSGPEAGRPFWTGRINVDFTMFDEARERPGRWLAYVPGPVTPIPWARDAEEPNDAMVAGGFYPLGSGRKLLTPLDPAG